MAKVSAVLNLYPKVKLTDRICCPCGETLIFTSNFFIKGECPECGMEYDRNLIYNKAKKLWEPFKLC